MTYYFLYKTINLDTGKYYIGVHETSNIDDGYLGSGLLLKRAICSHGKEKFKREIIEFFSSKKEMYKRESEIVTEQFVDNDDNYNIAPGGTGGSMKMNRKPFNGPHNINAKNKISNAARNRVHSAETKEKISKNSWAKKDPESQRLHAIRAAYKSHENRKLDDYQITDLTKEKISKSLKEWNRNNKSPVLGMKREKIKCPHCNIYGAKNTMTRWHFDNCKNK